MRFKLFLFVISLSSSNVVFPCDIEHVAEKIAVNLYNKTDILEEDVDLLYTYAKNYKYLDLIDGSEYSDTKKSFYDLGLKDKLIETFLISFEAISHKDLDTDINKKIKTCALKIVLSYLD